MLVLSVLACIGEGASPTDSCAGELAWVWHRDADGDGFGGDAEVASFCGDAPAGWDVGGADCDDADPTTFPGAPELCDGRDQDCDGTLDEDPIDPAAGFQDLDGDGAGDPAQPVTGCVGGVDGDDCDDTNPDAHPGADDPYGDADLDCDGSPDPAADRVWTAPDAEYTWSVEALPDIPPVGVLRDEDGDGRAELVIGGSGNGTETLWFLEGEEVGSLDVATGAGIPNPGAWCDGDPLLAVADFDGDGRSDLAVTTSDLCEDLLTVFLGPLLAGGEWADARLQLTSGELEFPDAPFALGDQDGDGLPEIGIAGLSVNRAGVTAIRVVPGSTTGAGTIDDVVVGGIDGEGTNFSEVHPAGTDADGDGVEDVIVGYPSAWREEGDEGLVCRFLGPLLTLRSVDDADACARGPNGDVYLGQQVVPGDLDGDGHPELLALASKDTVDGIDARSSFRLSALFEDGEEADGDRILGTDAVAVPRDIDGDGVLDLVWQDLDAVHAMPGPMLGTVDRDDATWRIANEVTSYPLDNTLLIGDDVSGDGQPDLVVDRPGAVLIFTGLSL